MKQSIADRELVALDGDGVLMRGTYHKPRAAGGAAIRLLPGIMFLNSLLTPRAAFGDTAVRWAESFARRGYPCFRFDLPGQGDSDGKPRPSCWTLWTTVDTTPSLTARRQSW